MTAGFLTGDEAAAIPPRAVRAADCVARRAARASRSIWVAAERLPELRAVHPRSRVAADRRAAARDERACGRATRRSSSCCVGAWRSSVPTTAAALAASLDIAEADAHAALLDLEGAGRGASRHASAGGSATNSSGAIARLLARIHRYTLNRLRAEIEPVSPADFMRFLFVWQHVDPAHRLSGIDGLRALVARLDGFELPGRAWERAVLPARARSLRAVDARHAVPHRPRGVGSVVAAHAEPARRVVPARARRRVARAASGCPDPDRRRRAAARCDAGRVLEMLRAGGASFLRDIAWSSGLTEAAAAHAIATLTVAGLVASDGFAGVRAVIRALKSAPAQFSRRDMTGRWWPWPSSSMDRERAVETQASVLLERYGVRLSSIALA